MAVQGGPFGQRAAAFGSLSCRFGTEPLSPARRVSSEVIECIAPAHEARMARVEVTMNGVDFTSDGVVFAYLAPTVHAVHPALGPERGGTRVVVNGLNMLQGASAVCRFGTVNTPAMWVSTFQMQCVTPSMPTGACTVALFGTSMSNHVLA